MQVFSVMMKKMRDSWLKSHAIGKSDKGDAHSYLEVYDLLFARFTGKKVSLLEVGVKDGGSLSMWKNYFEPDSVIHGIENQSVKFLNGVAVFFGNAYTDEMVNRLGTYDIVIDDGSHKLADVKFFIQRYLGRVNPGGLLIVEDIQVGVNAKDLYAVVPSNLRPFSYIVDCRYSKGREDDVLFVVYKQ